MPDAGQFTLNLFDSTALGWTVPIPTRDEPEDAGDTGADDEITAPVSRTVPATATRRVAAVNYRLDGDRALARGWPSRARDNIAAIRLSKQIEDEGGAATPDQQALLMRYVAFGASDLAQSAFIAPGEGSFRQGWEQIGDDLRESVTSLEYAALQRVTQYAHYTSEPIVRAVWRAAQRLGFAGGRVLEPGMGTGLFFAAMPDELRRACRLTGVEYDPVTARIARLLHPRATIRAEDYTRSTLGDGFHLAIGNPPFSARTVRADPRTASLGLQLHDYFIARSISRLKPGGLALFVTSTGTMDKTGTTAREHIAGMADLVGAVRLPEYSMHATAGTHVVVDVLVFQRRGEGALPGGHAWQDLVEVAVADDATDESTAEVEEAENEASPDAPTVPRHLRRGTVMVNEYFIAHPEMVLGTHAQRRGIYGIGRSYTCLPHPNADDLETQLDAALSRLPGGIHTPNPDALTDEEPETAESTVTIGRAADGATVKEGSYLNGPGGRLCQVVDGAVTPIAIKDGKTKEGISPKAAKVIRGLMVVRDAVRDVLRAQADGKPCQEQQVRLRCAYSNFIRHYGPINHTTVSVQTDADTGEEREQHRRPNLAHFADDPDCWLVASIEHYDVDNGVARRGPIFSERVISPPTSPIVTTPADALAVTLNATGRVDPDHIAELLECSTAEAMERLDQSVFLNPATETWETADAYLSGPVRHKLAAAEIAAKLEARYARNVEALRLVQPQDLLPSDITARLGAPWLPDDVIEAFVREVMEGDVQIRHTEAFATWTVVAASFGTTAAGTSTWGTGRRDATSLLHDALNGSTPQIFDVIVEQGTERRVLNPEETEAAKEKLTKIKTAFSDWVWTDSERADRLSRIYNDRFNNLVPRSFDGAHLTLPGASAVVGFYPHQKNVVWRIIAAGSTYIAHAVGAGKTFTMIAAIMEQRRLGLIRKAMVRGAWPLPGAVQPRVPAALPERPHPGRRRDQLRQGEARPVPRPRRDRRVGRHHHHPQRVQVHRHPRRLRARHDPGRVGPDRGGRDRRRPGRPHHPQAHRSAERAPGGETGDATGAPGRHADDRRNGHRPAHRRRGAGVQEADLRDQPHRAEGRRSRTARSGHGTSTSSAAFIATIEPPARSDPGVRHAHHQHDGRAVHLAPLPGRGPVARPRAVHEFDAWAACFGETRVELELQPSGAYKPVERFSQFVNIPELIDMFRTVADVVQKDDLRDYVRSAQDQGRASGSSSPRRPATTSAPTRRRLAERIEKIKQPNGQGREGRRHPAVRHHRRPPRRHRHADGPGCARSTITENKLNRLVRNVHADLAGQRRSRRFKQADGTPFPITGAAQMIFSDLGTLAAEDKRGFSAYAWIKVRADPPRRAARAEIAVMQHFKRSTEKQRLFNDINAGRVRIVLGSTQTMGTGVNAQLRLVALHHLDVPWLPSDIEQREGRIERQGNQNDGGGGVCLCHARLHGRDHVAEQRTQAALHPVPLSAVTVQRPQAGGRGGRRRPVRTRQGHRIGRCAADAEGRTGKRDRADWTGSAPPTSTTNSRCGGASAICSYEQEHARTSAAPNRSAVDIVQHVSTRGDAFVFLASDRRITERRVAGGVDPVAGCACWSEPARTRRQGDSSARSAASIWSVMPAGPGAASSKQPCCCAATALDEPKS